MKFQFRHNLFNLISITFIFVAPTVAQNDGTNSRLIQQLLRQLQKKNCDQNPGPGPQLMNTVLSIAKTNGVLPDVLPALRSVLPANQQDLLNVGQNTLNTQPNSQILITSPAQRIGSGLILPKSQFPQQTEVRNQNDQISLRSPNLSPGAVPQTLLPVRESLQSSQQEPVDSLNQNSLLPFLSSNLVSRAAVQSIYQPSNLPSPLISSVIPEGPVQLKQRSLPVTSSCSALQKPTYQASGTLQNDRSTVQEIKPAQNVQLNKVAPVLPCTNNAAACPTTKAISQNTVISDEKVQLPLNLHITLPPPSIPTPRIAIVSPTSGICSCSTPCQQPSSCQAPSPVPCQPAYQEALYCPVPSVNAMPPIILDSGSGNRDSGLDKSLLSILFLSLLGNGFGKNGCSSGYGGNGGGCGCGSNICGCNSIINGVGCGYPYNCGCYNSPLPMPYPVPVPVPYSLPDDSSEEDSSEE